MNEIEKMKISGDDFGHNLNNALGPQIRLTMKFQLYNHTAEHLIAQLYTQMERNMHIALEIRGEQL